VGPLQGTISTHLLNGADLSWLVGIVVAAGIYLIGMRGKVRVPGAPLTQAVGQPTL
jgi:hypothetical protein